MATIEDLRALGYEVGVSFERDGLTVYRVKTPWVSTQVRSDDQDAIDSLANPATYTEGRFQHEQPEAHQARQEIERKGYDVTRPDPVVDVFDVVDPTVPEVVEAGKTPAELPAVAEALPPAGA